jgi:hypothetical protein
MGALSPIFAWFEGGDVIQFGNLCPTCAPDVKRECRLWRLDTLDGVATKKPRIARDCLFFIKWRDEVLTCQHLTGEEVEEGKKNLSCCPSCGKRTLATVTRTSSEFGTRMNPRIAVFSWCGCGHFSAEKRELDERSEQCVFCGHLVAQTESTVFGGSIYHIECLLRLRFFFTMGEMLRVAQGYAVSGKTLGMADSETAMKKTIHMVRAFRVTGNGNLLGVNRVIHWLEGESPLVTDRTVLRSRQLLQDYLETIFKGEAERSVGIHILDDGYVVYNNASDVRWITHGAYKPVRMVSELLETYVDAAGKCDWRSLEKYLLKEVADGKCVVCGALTRSHRIAACEEEKNVYACHQCWTEGAGKRQ